MLVCVVMRQDKNKKKLRTEFRKNRLTRTRPGDLTRQFRKGDGDDDRAVREERSAARAS